MMDLQERNTKVSRFKTVKMVAFFLLVILVGSFIFFRLFGPRLKQGADRAKESTFFVAEDLMGRLSQLEKNKDFTSDYSIPILNTGDFSFHIHALQVGQFCPLHVHTDSEEAVIILRGQGKIRSLIEEEKSSERRIQVQEFSIERGGFFYAARKNAHEFVNESEEEMLACLVIHNPPFHGNLYVKEEEIERTSTSFYKNLIAIADSMTGAKSDEVAVAEINAFPGIEIRLMRTKAPLNENMSRGHDLVIIMLQGEAALEVADERVSLNPFYFIGIPARNPFTIIPSETANDCYFLCFYLIPAA